MIYLSIGGLLEYHGQDPCSSSGIEVSVAEC